MQPVGKGTIMYTLLNCESASHEGSQRGISRRGQIDIFARTIPSYLNVLV
jgi:hypothetical protein